MVARIWAVVYRNNWCNRIRRTALVDARKDVGSHAVSAGTKAGNLLRYWCPKVYHPTLMKLEQVEIARYRSAQHVELENIGALNVLIGKNNSGKSTILSSIDIFFRCVRNSRLVSTTPPIGRKFDFAHQATTEPILFTFTFALLPEERTTLVGDIATEAPQLKNAFGGLDALTFLEATLAITCEPDSYSYIKALHLVGDPKTPNLLARRSLLTVEPKAANELAIRQRTALSSTDTAEALTRTLSGFDEDDFNRIKRAAEPLSSFVRFGMLRRQTSELSRNAVDALDEIFRESTSYSDFRTKFVDLKDSFLAMARTADQEPLKNTVETFSGNQSSIPNYVNNLIKVLSEIKVLYLTERREPVGRAEARQLLSFKVTRGGPEKLRNIQQTIESLLGVQVDAFESSVSSPAQEKGAEMDVGNFLLEVNGSGIREALRLVLDVEFKKPSILLVEEPEVHLHPALEINMMRYLKHVSRECQVFLSTHSTNFLDTADMKNVYFVSKPHAVTEVQLLNVEEAEAKLPKELGIRLSSLFMFDRLVFVEGPTDEAIIREWATTLHINLSQANVGFISMGGVRNFAHYANQTIFNFLTKRQVSIWFVVDRDERDRAEVQEMENKLANKAHVQVLDRREIENYLLAPRAIVEFIKGKRKQLPPGNYPEINELAVSAAIEECAEQLKDHAIGKRIVKKVCVPLYPTFRWSPADRADNAETLLTAEIAKLRTQIDETEARVKQAIADARLDVDGSWKSNKTALVPGDVLLDEVCKRFGTRFKKDADGVKLAGLMTDYEIPVEIKDLLQEIAR
jgi:putative ATP-dependent endonuclease of the OLD family